MRKKSGMELTIHSISPDRVLPVVGAGLRIPSYTPFGTPRTIANPSAIDNKVTLGHKCDGKRVLMDCPDSVFPGVNVTIR